MIFVGMACVAVLGWATTWLLARIEERAMPWIPAGRG
jgi:ABC-type nitrate/sulfonate/bicarbonate transport system permease component